MDNSTTSNSKPTTERLDAMIIGAGFGGLYMLRKLRDEMGLKVRGYDRASDVGGTWYWNRYPGALSDTETYLYCYSFDKELLQEQQWDTRYINQPKILSYLEGVADRYDLRKDIQFNTGITAAHFNEQSERWDVVTDQGDTISTKYLVTALGLLSSANLPNFKGRENFKGEQYHTGAWPKGVEFKGKRVGVIGTGSTGIQVVTAIAPQVDHLTVFQRTAQYSVPVGNGTVSAEEVAEVKRNYDQIWRKVKESMTAFGFEESTVPAMSVSDEEREAIFQKVWDEGGGFRFMFGAFGDIVTNEAANEAACEFVRGKISEIVKDPETARKLSPTDYYAKRPLCDGGYYAMYNRDNVSLVSIKENPIDEITATGVRTADGVEHELDMLIFATGFDAVDGSYTKIDLRGREGESIKEHWKAGPTSFLGMTVSKFPNMFMVLGPNGPFTNLPPSIETQVEWIADCISHTQSVGAKVVEATPQAESSWTATCQEVADETLFSKGNSWIFGANIPGKANAVMFYMAGLAEYRKVLNNVSGNEYQGFDIPNPSASDPALAKSQAAG